MTKRKVLRAVVIIFAAVASAVVFGGLYVRHKFAQKTPWPAAAVRGAKVMVVSDEALADEAGIEILKKGGNAVDAAVAVGFALAVVEPGAGNIGGGGFMLIRQTNGKAAFVDYRETAPQKAGRNMYASGGGRSGDDESRVGYRAVAVPGTVAGMALALRTYGTMPLSQVMQPAIRLAEGGFSADERLTSSLHDDSATLSRFAVSKRIFLNAGREFQMGELIRQPELEATLRRIALNGPDEFYRGETAHHLANDMAKSGGLITLEDLAAYRPKIREPLRATYHYNGHQWEVIASPPPSSGGIAIIEALNILDSVPLKGWNDVQSVHWMAETMRRVFADRAAWLADSDFSHVPVQGLTDPRYAAQIRATIDPEKPTPSRLVKAGDPMPFDSNASPVAAMVGPLPPDDARAWTEREAKRSGHTTHYSVVDADGNAVSNTYTLNDWYGSGVTSSDGYLLNDEMDDFTAHQGQPNMYGLVQSQANTIEPGKRPLSSMSPSILLRDGELSFVTGSPGGPTIISATLLTIVNWMRLGMDAQTDINAPRFHHQWVPDELVLESNFPQETARELRQRGYVLNPSIWLRFWLNPPVHIGQVEAIGIDPKSGERLGAADPRDQGVALGY